jgi:hypothetical protein
MTVSILEEQIAVRRRRRDNDIAALFRFGSEIAAENVVHRVHRLRPAAKRQNGWIYLGRVVVVGKNDFVMDDRIVHLLRLFEHLRPEGLDQKRSRGREGQDKQHPL